MFHLKIMLFAVLLFILPFQSQCVVLLDKELCKTVAQSDCQNSSSTDEYIQCWKEKVETCSLALAIQSHHRTGNECYVEEQLTTELVCFDDDCQNVSYHEYFLVCS